MADEAAGRKTSVLLNTERHPTIKMLALSFLILIGVALIGDGLDMHIPKGYIYHRSSFTPRWLISSYGPALEFK
ncbi:MAG TPA: hypothetical protein VGJ93_12315 [Desulfuromonadaceae bacterium]|jgi:predicted tellurium resistance membrane protein TerC